MIATRALSRRLSCGARPRKRRGAGALTLARGGLDTGASSGKKKRRAPAAGRVGRASGYTGRSVPVFRFALVLFVVVVVVLVVVFLVLLVVESILVVVLLVVVFFLLVTLEGILLLPSLIIIVATTNERLDIVL